MRRSIVILGLILALGSGIALGSYSIARSICVHQMAKKADDLSWLREEFHLNEVEMQRVRELHEGYLPKCRQMCGRIEAKKEELHVELGRGKGVTPEVEQKMLELGNLRCQCQIQMLRHFMDVSKTMPHGEGDRYWSEMQRLTLGFHEQFEEGMKAGSTTPHGHH
jgi:hypothetical protein